MEITKREIAHTLQNDYPYGMVISDEITAKWVAHIASGITCKNFKFEVAATRGYDFAHHLMKVWSPMHEVEDAGARL